MRPHPQFVARVSAVAVIAADLAASPKLRGAEVVRPARCFEEALTPIDIEPRKQILYATLLGFDDAIGACPRSIS